MFSRTKALIGDDAFNKLNNSNVIVFGVGGVGGFAVEGLVRSGIGSITIVDNDDVNITNINRQIIALNSTIGKSKVDVMEERIKDINPLCNVKKIKMFYLPEENDKIDLNGYDYIIDCIDTIKAKIDLVVRANELNIPIISCMGMGNKIDPTLIKISDIYKTTVCPLARTMRYELRKRNIKKLKVCYSLEEPFKVNLSTDEDIRRSTPASISFVPSVAGLIIAGEVIKDLGNIRR